MGLHLHIYPSTKVSYNASMTLPNPSENIGHRFSGGAAPAPPLLGGEPWGRRGPSPPAREYHLGYHLVATHFARGSKRKERAKLVHKSSSVNASRKKTLYLSTLLPNDQTCMCHHFQDFLTFFIFGSVCRRCAVLTGSFDGGLASIFLSIYQSQLQCINDITQPPVKI